MEVMTATAVLSLGTVLIYEAFFISLDSYNYCSDYLNVIPWADEKLWQAQDDLNRFGVLDLPETRGIFTNRNKQFAWSLSDTLIEETAGLHRIDLALSWQEGQRKAELSRSAYAMYVEQK